ncbi:MAG: hypothetical protein K2Q06_09440, partial [Parvularculaceae bacterium]|nr:hypothetical protein [Parvularculaceae bacterium]
TPPARRGMIRPMILSSIRWVRAVLGAVAAEAAQVAAAFGWVVVYSHAIRPGETLEHYQSYAQTAAPWVAIVAGLPIFYAASRWIAGNFASALVLWGVFVAIDLALLFSAPSDAPTPWGLIALSFLSKLLACVFGGRAAEARRRTQAG